MSEIQKISLGIVVNKDNEVLLVNRTSKKELSDGSLLSWAFPGGKVEQDENPKEAVERELLEETGYKVIANEIIYKNNHLLTPIYVYYFGCSLVEGLEKHETRDAAIIESAWISINGLSNFLTSPINPEVSQYLNNRLC